ncbi:hypothetical protein EX895_000869 [Sporisorium graminicola]|uniref:Uncharacterized protein n=1 Tax=Sporisorium graminicola TaxID=280036 RepID=A0A4U7L0W4_9BASI|nr:hypothetical protein EX895_000869 [Sporisorium graminicola]TKY90871.1 hypothetical protein EX895_000869 [Sporisorium graminicola]
MRIITDAKDASRQRRHHRTLDLGPPHPFGVWHLNRDGPTSLPHPPRRTVSAPFVRQSYALSTRPTLKHTRNVLSLGILPDLSSVKVSSLRNTKPQGPSLGYAQVRTSGFPFIMPDSDSEYPNTPAATEPASDIGSLRDFNALSDAGSANMSRSFSDQPSMRSYEESSVSAKGPGATINRKAGEHLGSSLRNHFTPSPRPSSMAHTPSVAQHQQDNDRLSAVEHRGAPGAPPGPHDCELSPATVQSNLISYHSAQQPATRPLSYSTNASIESTGSPIMTMRPLSTAEPSLRDFPVNTNYKHSLESVNAPIRQRTDSRPTISPTNTSRAISTPAPMPLPQALPQALQDHRPTVRRAQGQRAESEVVRSRTSSKPFSFPARASAQFTSRERADILPEKSTKDKNGSSFIRRLIRRASLKGNKPQSAGGTPAFVLSPSKTSVALPAELERELQSEATTPRAESISSRSASKEFKRRTSLTRRRSKSKEPGVSKTSRTSSIFAPFLARDPNKVNSVFRTKREESFGHLGPLPVDDAPPFPKDGLPLSSSSPFLAHDLVSTSFTRANNDNVESRDFAIVQAPTRAPASSSSHQHEAAETLESPRLEQGQDLASDADADETQQQRPLSHVTDKTDNSLGMGMALSSRNNFNFQESLGLNELSATPRSHSQAVDPAATSSGHGQPALSSDGHPSTTETNSRPRPSIPRIWQGLEPTDGDHTLRSTHIDDADSSDDTPPEHHLPANRFDTATTASSFRTAASHLDSPQSSSTRRTVSGSRASRLSVRTQDTPLARHFDQGPRLDSPLADLITNLGRSRSISGTMSSAPYHDAAASPSSEFLHLDPETNRTTVVAAGPSPSPSLTQHDAEHYESPDEDDDDTSLRAQPRQTHLPAASHTALVETIDHSNPHSPIDPTDLTPTQVKDSADGSYPRYRRGTFGGLDPTPVATVEARQADETTADPTRPQLSRFSTATSGPENDDHPVTRSGGDDSEEQEVVLPEVKVFEIESHLAAVEAALQDNREEGSFDVASLRQRISDASYVMHANASSASMLSRDGSLQPPQQQSFNESTDELAPPGAWTRDSSSFVMNDDGRRITLAPESHEALADAVRSVRRAISSSQLTTDADDTQTALANRSVETLGMESFVSEGDEPTSERLPAGEASMLSEATPAKAAKRRQEGMRDIEEAYSRMLALVQSSAIGVTPSPQMRGEEPRLGFEPPRRPMKHGQATSSANEPFFNSPLAKASTKTDEPLSQPAQSTRSILDGAGGSQPARTQGRGQPNTETRTSTSLSGLMGMPLDINPHMLRQASVSTVSSVHDVSRNDSVDGAAFARRRPPSVAKSSSSRYSQALSRDHAPSSLMESDGFRKRFSTDNTTIGRASSGGGHTSPSATAKTLGTPRSFATSVSQHSLANIVRRHELEKESLLDTLERVRAENADLHSRHNSLTSDLHAEVTRVLELERELERRDSREVTLIGQIQQLEHELVELRYLDFQLNSTADQTLGSEDGEGSIMDVELPPTLQSRVGIGALPLSPRGVVQPSPSYSSASVSALAKPTHRSTRSEAFVSGLPGSERSTLPASRSELPRARPVSLLNGPGGLFREDRTSQRTSQASPLPTPRTSSLLRHPRTSGRLAKAQAASPNLLGLGLPRDEDDVWSIADEQLPEIDDEILPPSSTFSSRQQASTASAGPVHTFDSQLGETGHPEGSYERSDEDGDDRQSSSVPSTDQHNSAMSGITNGVTPQRDVSPSSLPRSTSQATVTKITTQLPRPSPSTSKIPTSRSTSGISDSPSHRSVSSRLPRLGLKPSTRYSTSSGIRNVSNATDKSTASTLSSVYSNLSTGAPPSLGSLPSGNNTMEDEIQAELARLGNPQPYMRYYSPPRSKML